MENTRETSWSTTKHSSSSFIAEHPASSSSFIAEHPASSSTNEHSPFSSSIAERPTSSSTTEHSSSSSIVVHRTSSFTAERPTSLSTTEHSSTSSVAEHSSSSTITKYSPYSLVPSEEVHEVIEIESEEYRQVLYTNSNTNRLFIPRKSTGSSLVKKESTDLSEEKKRSTHRTRYLSSWENEATAQYSSYYYDNLGEKHTQLICWLHKKIDRNNGAISLGCRLCEKHDKIGHKNGKENKWATTGCNVLALDKIKEHHSNSRHQEAQKAELQLTSKSQPDWISTRTHILSQQQESVQNLMYCCIHLCQNDQSLNSFPPLCDLLERVDVKLLPAEISGVSYRNDNAALTFIQHIANALHIDLLNKLKNSPTLGWMMDESTSRSTQKSCIVYVRYLDNFKPRTSFYGLINMEGNGSADNIVQRLIELWGKDDLLPSNTCWLATDNASIHDGVAAKLRKNHDMSCLELSTCVAHTYALVGKHAGQCLDENGKIKTRQLIADFEGIIGKIYNYFNRSTNRQYKLKQWYNFLTMPEIKFKRLFDIRWLSIRDCLKPIMANMRPGNQALLALLECISNDPNVTQNERAAAAELLNELLDDRFLFVLHFHFDIHECISGELTKIMQRDDISYKTLMDTIADKKNILISWTKKDQNGMCPWGPSLAEYLNSTNNGDSFGAFKIHSGTNRDDLAAECSLHIERLLKEIDRRYPKSELHQYLSVLFDPIMLQENRVYLNDATFGRLELNSLRQKYVKLSNFDAKQVSIEWESFKPLSVNFLGTKPSKISPGVFWENFIQLKQTTHERFCEQFKNILILLSIYLISPMNSAECERGYSAANRIQTTSRSRITIETLDCLLTVRLLLNEDIRSIRCQEMVQQAFKSWNNPESSRRLNRIKLLIDVPDDYQPCRQVRSSTKRQQLDDHIPDSGNSIQPKRRKTNAIKCANRCGKTISSDDSMQMNAILCCHQNEYYQWIDKEDSCRRWLCNFCRIKLAISTETILWFCDDHEDIHEETEETTA